MKNSQTDKKCHFPKYPEKSLPVQSVPITTKVVSLNPVHVEVHSIQHYVIKFVSDLRQVGSFLRVLRFPPPIKLTITIKLNMVESGIKHHKPKKNVCYFVAHKLHCI